MNILVIDDIQGKRDEVVSAIKELRLNREINVRTAKSFISGVRELNKEAVDVLILDLNLPTRDGELPDPCGGERVLMEITAGEECKRPAHIIGLTEHPELGQEVLSDQFKNLVHIVNYSSGNVEWINGLQTKLEYVAKRLDGSERAPDRYRADIAIITSSPLVELREVKRLPGNFVGEFNRSDSIDYYTAEWKIASTGRTLDVVACAAPLMGMTAACATASKLIERWRPRFIVMPGIAAGTKREGQAFGDILVAHTVFDYGSGKIEDSAEAERTFIPSPNPLVVDAELHAVLQRWEQNQNRMRDIQNAWSQAAQSQTPKLIVGVIASGAAVVQSQPMVEEIVRHSRKVVGLEMEAYGVFHAAHLARNPRPRVLIAKAISDFANSEKKDDWQQLAAFNSARFVYEFFTQSSEFGLGH